MHCPKTTKILSIILCFAFIFGALTFSASAAEICVEATGSNVGKNEYVYYWSTARTSFLEPIDDGFMKLQAGAVDGKYLIEYYDADFNQTKTLLVNEELSIFGGFYSMNGNFYILSGQTNYNELPSIEVFRITKYDKNWKRLKSVGIYDCNTTTPFDAGNARFDHYGDYLFIRTAHEMYSIDGICHQANVTIQLDTTTMKVTDHLTDVSNPACGYVSHSFNQFIKIDGGKLVTLDHGDAYPRSIALIKYPSDNLQSGSFFSWDCELIDVLTIPGAIGENYTGVEVGGFEYSKTSYLAAYNSVNLKAKSKFVETANVFVSAVNKETNEITTVQVTDLIEGEETAGVPHLVKVSDDEFFILWAQGKTVYYTKLDGNGRVLGTIRAIPNAYLSDCAPILSENGISWYIYENEKTTFYTINTQNPDSISQKTVITGHDYKIISYPTASGESCKVKCAKCDDVQSFTTANDLKVYWSTSECCGTYTWPLKNPNFKVGSSVCIMIVDEGDLNASQRNEKVVEFSDESAIDYNAATGKITFLKAGNHTIKVYYKYNPSVYESYNLSVTGVSEAEIKVGDVNQSGEIDSMDYVLVKRAYFGTFSLSENQFELGDVNQSDEIDSMDYVLIKRAYFGTFAFE